MSKTEKLKEEQIFKQEVSDDELEAVAGGDGSRCKSGDWRDIYEGGFPNCAASVEDGSWCWTADACISEAINYYEMKECNKAWR